MMRRNVLPIMAIFLAETICVLMLTRVDCRSIDSGPEASSFQERHKASEELTVSFLFNGRLKSLKLTKNENLQSTIPVYVIERGHVTKWTDPREQEVCAFFNMETLDFVTMRKLSGGVAEFTGSFHDESQRYSLMPSRSNGDGMIGMDGRPLGGDTELYFVDINGIQHTVVKHDRPAAEANEDHHLASIDEPSLHRIRKRSVTSSDGKQQHVVDYAAVIDYSIFNRWFSASQETDISLRRQEANRNIVTYYAYVVHMIDMRYATINEADFGIRVRFIGYYIASTPADSFFTESPDVKVIWKGFAYSEAFKALTSIGNYVANNSQLFGTADHVGLFTGNNLYMGPFNGYDAPVSISGLAWIGGVCTQTNRVSVSRDQVGQYSIVQSSAHELAHNLGARHDGENNACNSSDQFIMATAPGQLTTANFDNTFRFSSCSIAAIRGFLKSSTSSVQCLLSKADSSDIPFRANPGQYWNASQQCQQIFGAESFYCAGNLNDQTICNRMPCWNPIDQTCTTISFEQRAFDGTTCGNRRWCQTGRCVSDPAAPPTSDTCVYGDFRGMLTINSVSMTCAQMGLTTPSACYDNYYASVCCQTCSSLRASSPNPPSCAFGDRVPAICREKTKRLMCYDASFLSDCCDTCRLRQSVDILDSSNDDCLYGDKADWCPNISTTSCYQVNSTCCETCKKAETGIIGCLYGDQVGWCNSQDLSTMCKADENIAKICCGSCAAVVAMPTSSSTTTSTSLPTTQTSTATSPTTTRNPTTATTTTTTTTRLPTNPSTTIATTSMTTAMPTAPVAMTTPMSNALIDKLGFSYCSTLKVGQWCYSSSGDCCRTCSNAYTGIAGCEFGDSAPWCSSYVQGPNECSRPEVASLCCKTCEKYRPNNCTDNADWCSTIYPGQCYNDQTRATCCATCSQNRQQIANTCCPYGDKYSWCKKEYCSTNARDCCATCAY